MKISKLLPAVGVLVFCVSFGSLRAQDNAAQAAARAALMKQMDQVQAPEPQTSPAAPAMVPEPAAAAPVVEPTTPVAPVTLVMQTNAVVAPPAAVMNPRPVPIIAPGLPVSLSKEQRLQTLLMLYKADQITPEQYHTKRAAILAEP
jgi:hypothetical protein